MEKRRGTSVVSWAQQPHGRRWLIAIGLVAVVLGIWLSSSWWRAHQPLPTGGFAQGPEPPTTHQPRPVPLDPRVAITSPFLNTRPEVRYVGDDACTSCHRTITHQFHQHPMARSMETANHPPVLERFDEAARDPFQVGNFTYQAQRRGDKTIHGETLRDPSGRVLATFESEIGYNVGSGARGRSYILDRDGFLFASALTWYVEKKRWDLSPGYERTNLHFGRPIVHACLFCHCNQAEVIAGTSNGYKPPVFRGLAIGCERCHGPGELHVQRRRAPEPMEGEIDTTIVNPRHLEHGPREDVCRQCHLQGEQRILPRGRSEFEYRPGLPLAWFLKDFVRNVPHAADRKFVGTVEQMQASRCYRESKGAGKLGCISCHDSHEVPESAKKVSYYRERCLACHEDKKGCTLPIELRLAKQDNCLTCHMPRSSSDAPHLSITDHRILRRPSPIGSGSAQGDGVRAGTIPLVPFGEEGTQITTGEAGRDLGLALVEFTEKLAADSARLVARQALPLLDAALVADPDDVAARDARGSALWLMGRKEEALTAYKATLELAPAHEMTLFTGTTLAVQLGKTDLALVWGRQLVRVNPARWQHQGVLAESLALSGDWQAAADACRESLRTYPAGFAARQLLIQCLLRLGAANTAKQELETLVALAPPERHEAIRRMFAELVRTSNAGTPRR